MNPLLNNPFVKQGPQVNPQVKQLMGLFNGPNPMQTFMQLVGNSPKAQFAINMLNSGANPEQIVRQICKEQGIDVNQYMSQFRQQG